MIFKKTTKTSRLELQVNAPKPQKKTMATLRLKKDLANYHSDKIDFIKMSFKDEDNLQQILVDVQPQQNSIYFGCAVQFSLSFPDDYPISPPKLLCLNKIYHPNINYKGNVCLPLVRQDYSPTVNLTSIICGLIYILSYPNAEDALNPEIGELMEKDYKMFLKIVEHTSGGRSFKNRDYDKIRLEKEGRVK